MKKLTYKNLLIFLLGAAFFALLFAHISQYFFGLEPCVMCYYQRIPFFLVIFVALVALNFSRLKNHQKLLAQLAVFLLLINSFIAFYHSAIEKKIIEGPHTCSSGIKTPLDIEELKLTLIQQSPAVRCDQPKFIFLGLSMANWNVIYCLSLAITSIIVLRKIKSSR